MRNSQDKEQAFIETLSIHNFKKFDNVTVDFKPGLNLLVGPNNSGKSTILEALDTVLGERGISSSTIKRNLFHTFTDGKENVAHLIVKLRYPQCGSGANDINLIKHLKKGKGSTRSSLPCFCSQGEHYDVGKILNSKFPTDDFRDNLGTSSIKISEVFLVTEIIVDSENNPEVDYSVYINVIRESDYDGNTNETYKIIGISGVQRSALLNYLFLPANRYKNQQLFEISDFNWLGRYISSYAKENKKVNEIEDCVEQLKYPNILDENCRKITQELLGKNTKIDLNLLNTDDPESLIINSKVYVHDGINDEALNKGQGMQSATAISLFHGWCKFRAKKVPQHGKLSSDWSTIISIEEPESHFQLPLKNKLLKIIKENFIDNGAQVFISTHDDSFVNWSYITSANIVLPNSIQEQKAVSLNFIDKDEYQKRLIRFHNKCLFSKWVLVTEGQEEVCIDLILQELVKRSPSDLGLLLTRSVGRVRSKDDPNSDTQAGGGKDDIDKNIAFLNELGINSVVLLDADVLFKQGSSVKRLYKLLTNNDLTFDFSSIPPLQTGNEPDYLKLKRWWSQNKDSSAVNGITEILNEAGIFLLPGDFESLFTDEFLKNFEVTIKDSDGNIKIGIIKEKLVYDVKFRIETNDDVSAIFEKDSAIYASEFINKIETYIEKKEAEVRLEVIQTVTQIQNEITKPEQPVDDELPF